MEGKIEDIKSISAYNSAYRLLDENTTSDFWKDFDEEDICFLEHFDDFEGYQYFVINYDYVLTTICEDVIGNAMSMDEFIDSVMELLKEDRENRQ